MFAMICNNLFGKIVIYDMYWKPILPHYRSTSDASIPVDG